MNTLILNLGPTLLRLNIFYCIQTMGPDRSYYSIDSPFPKGRGMAVV